MLQIAPKDVVVSTMHDYEWIIHLKNAQKTLEC